MIDTFAADMQRRLSMGLRLGRREARADTMQAPKFALSFASAARIFAVAFTSHSSAGLMNMDIPLHFEVHPACSIRGTPPIGHLNAHPLTGRPHTP
jgi:hypothetical protein